jgi:hypothetical protein
MIHHLARAFAIRQEMGLAASALNGPSSPARPPAPAPVRPRPITPWGGQPRLMSVHQGTPSLRISADPQDARRTVIAGRFAEVCAALDRLVMEQEAIA